MKVSVTDPSVQDNLDPTDWEAFRETARRALDIVVDHMKNRRSMPVWQPVPSQSRQIVATGPSMPSEGRSLEELVEIVRQHVLPYSMGNGHPGFTGWFIGAGNVAGFLGEMMASGLNTSVAGYDQAATYVENQVIEWFKDLFGFAASASGVIVSGTSIAMLISVLVARYSVLGIEGRTLGVRDGDSLVGYGSASGHNSGQRAFEAAGLGSANLRVVPCTQDYRIDCEALEEHIKADLAAGRRPFLIIGNAGTIDTGAFDDLVRLRTIATKFGMWLHVDGAFGALTALSDTLSALVKGIEHVDSVAFDFHKWPHVPYDAGCVLVRDGEIHRSSFSTYSAYLSRDTRGMANARPWFPDLGLELSRSFRSLKIWMTIQHYGRARLGNSIDRCCQLAREFADLVGKSTEFELCAPVSLNIVCFRFVGTESRNDDGLNELNRRLVQDLQLTGVVAPSSTVLGGRTCIRVAVANHRTTWEDLVLTLTTARDLARVANEFESSNASVPEVLSKAAS